MSQINPSRMTKNERREQARQKAREAREAQLKQERKKRLVIQSSIVLGVIAVLAIVGLVIAQAVKPAGPGPENMASGGAVFAGENFEVQKTAAINPGEQLVAQPVDREKAPLDIVVYVDYMCPHCGLFEQEAGPMLEQWVGSGQATLQVYPLNFQDNASKGTRYSTRAANAFACLVEDQPDAAWSFHKSLLSQEIQPQQNSAGLPDDTLIDLALQAGATDSASLRSCITQVPFADFFTNTTRQALSGPIVGLADGVVLGDGMGGLQDPDEPQHITGTPAVMVNGMQAPTTVNELEQFMLKLFADLSPSDVEEATEEDAEEADTDEPAAKEDEEKKE